MINEVIGGGRQLLEDLALDMAPEVSKRLRGIADGLTNYPSDLSTTLDNLPQETRQMLAQNIFNISLLFSMLAGDIEIEKGFAHSMGVDSVLRRKMDGDCRKVAEEFRSVANVIAKV